MIQQLLTMLAALEQRGIRYAAIGGLAVVAHGIVRATEDLDFLVDSADRSALDQVMAALGFERLHVSDDAANYASDVCRVDFLFAHRPIALQLLTQAGIRKVWGHDLPVVDVEGIIGLKLQAYVNDPRRTLDPSDIRGLLSLHLSELDKSRVRAYCAALRPRTAPRPVSPRDRRRGWMREAKDDTRTHAPIAASAGIDTRAALSNRDPFEAFDALMELVEALLPDRPRLPRPPTRGRFLL